jgi:hypothetical protein
MLFAWRKPDNIAGLDFFHEPALTLNPSDTGGNDERLTKRVGVPGGARAGFKGSKVTFAPAVRAGALAWNNISTRTPPVNQSDGPFVDCRELFLLISIGSSLCQFDNIHVWARAVVDRKISCLRCQLRSRQSFMAAKQRL